MVEGRGQEKVQALLVQAAQGPVAAGAYPHLQTAQAELAITTQLASVAQTLEPVAPERRLEVQVEQLVADEQVEQSLVKAVMLPQVTHFWVVESTM